GVEYIAADLSDPAQARRAAEGADAIVYAVGLPYPRFAEHPVLMRTTVEAARAAGVRRLLAISTVYPYGRPRTPRVAETHPREPHTRKGRYRKEQEDIVLSADDAQGLRTIILRLPDFYGPTAEISYAKTLFDAVSAGTTANLLAPIDAPHEWIYVPDAAPVIADLLERDDAFGTAYNLGGTTASTRELVAAIGQAAGRTPKMRTIPPLMVWLIGRFDPTMRELFEMLYLWSDPVVLDDTKLRTVLGAIACTPLADGIAATVASTPVGNSTPA
ncbi:MAG TPA: NAD-dependent epimerase/dehydratase family protein, partial [Candidatus Acidoferrum sp.]|nr:NAD-dependent epimerase/dehydratase family protein [Candidatus Acidoferrum sp.]